MDNRNIMSASVDKLVEELNKLSMELCVAELFVKEYLREFVEDND